MRLKRTGEWQCSRYRDQQTTGNAERLLMPSPKVVIVGGFEVPAESMLPRGPEHEIQRGFRGHRVRRHAVLSGMNPLRANAEHELCSFG